MAVAPLRRRDNRAMALNDPIELLGGLSPQAFMRRHWQKKPLLIRQALPDATAPLTRTELFALAARDDVESRLVQRVDDAWRLRHGPLPRRALPPLKQPGWTLLVQGVDLHVGAAHALLSPFRFVPEARLDDLMLSFATHGGGVGPHLDSYDVFLLQLQGRRRWRIGRARDRRFVEAAPLKILRRFEPEQEWLLEPGDMLYLPPNWAHDGVADGDCLTASIGFRAPRRDELARELLLRVADTESPDGVLYADARQPATAEPGAIPPALQAYAAQAVQRLLDGPGVVQRALGEWLTEPKAQVRFEARRRPRALRALRLDRRTRMMYDQASIFINGESFAASGRDALLMRRLADQRALPAADVARLGRQARALVSEWVAAGWLSGDDE
jgi:50S ribosomal protein L16 3-hydroxylase